MSKQSGFALLALMVVLLGIGGYGLSKVLTSTVDSRHDQEQKKTRKALLEAKELLLSYALDYSIDNELGRMGRLPCPDVTDTAFPNDIEGNQDGVCGTQSINSIGYFPFKTLGQEKLEDGANECLWYIVSGEYKNSPASDMLNWDSVGYLNLEDEDANLAHGANDENFPIALIISPGKTIDQTRAADPALPLCRGSYTYSDYLEAGPNLDYAGYFPAAAGDLWRILNPSPASRLDNVDYNDTVVAIYRDELWNRIVKMGDLDIIDNLAKVAPETPVEVLTESLALCLAEYGKDGLNTNDNLPYPAPNDFPAPNDDYRVNANYQDSDATMRFGRFPQDVSNSDAATNVAAGANFVYDDNVVGGGPASYCRGKNVFPAGQESSYMGLWSNWKDHFFYLLSDDFNPASNTATAIGTEDRCDTGEGALDCLKIANNVSASHVAAIVLFAGEKQPGQVRFSNAEKRDPTNYLEGDFAGAVETGPGAGPGSGAGEQTFDLTSTTEDYAYCVMYSDALPDKFFINKCAILLP